MTLTEQADQPTSDARNRALNKKERVWKALAALAALVLVGFIVYVVTRPHHARPAAFPTSPPATLATGSPAPAFVLPRLGGGQPVSLVGSRGTPAIVNFFASWCRNCQAELSAFAALSAQMTGRVAIIGIDSNDSNTATAKSLLAKANATYPVGVDSTAKVATSYLLNALPVTYFLDASGRVVHVGFGAQRLATLDHWAAVLTGQAGHS
jgi:peroxiredoxin